MGIQQSRVNGLRISTGDYIIFLDQDDQLVTQNYISQVENMEYADVVVGNLYKDVDGKKKLL
ncbi:glycosyltransferase [Lactobacillus helveticus]|nr:glycosyltransferase [Lactobacillus helveticus]